MGASAAAVAFLLWLLYFHDPPPTLAQRWIFLPQLNALLNGLSAVALCVGLYFIKHKNWRAHRASVWLLVPVLGQLYREPRPTWRYAVPRRRNRSNDLFVNSGESHSVLNRRAAHGLDDVVFCAERPVQEAPPPRTSHVPYLVVCVCDRRRRVGISEGLCLLGRARRVRATPGRRRGGALARVQQRRRLRGRARENVTLRASAR